MWTVKRSSFWLFNLSARLSLLFGSSVTSSCQSGSWLAQHQHSPQQKFFFLFTTLSAASGKRRVSRYHIFIFLFYGEWKATSVIRIELPVIPALCIALHSLNTSRALSMSWGTSLGMETIVGQAVHTEQWFLVPYTRFHELPSKSITAFLGLSHGLHIKNKSFRVFTRKA